LFKRVKAQAFIEHYEAVLPKRARRAAAKTPLSSRKQTVARRTTGKAVRKK